MHPLVENLAATVEQAQGADEATSEPTDTTPVEFISGTSTTPSSFLSTPCTTLIPLATVKKLKAQMVILLHHIQPWIQKSIAQTVDHIDKKMAQGTERKLMEVHQCLDAFEFRVFARPATIVDLMTL